MLSSLYFYDREIARVDHDLGTLQYVPAFLESADAFALSAQLPPREAPYCAAEALWWLRGYAGLGNETPPTAAAGDVSQMAAEVVKLAHQLPHLGGISVVPQPMPRVFTSLNSIAALDAYVHSQASVVGPTEVFGELFASVFKPHRAKSELGIVRSGSDLGAPPHVLNSTHSVAAQPNTQAQTLLQRAMLLVLAAEVGVDAAAVTTGVVGPSICLLTEMPTVKLVAGALPSQLHSESLAQALGADFHTRDAGELLAAVNHMFGPTERLALRDVLLFAMLTGVEQLTCRDIVVGYGSQNTAQILPVRALTSVFVGSEARESAVLPWTVGGARTSRGVTAARVLDFAQTAGLSGAQTLRRAADMAYAVAELAALVADDLQAWPGCGPGMLTMFAAQIQDQSLYLGKQWGNFS